MEGDQASPHGYKHERCTRTECLQHAAQWWEAEWWLHHKEALTEKLAQAPADEHCADCAAMGLCERQCDHNHNQKLQKTAQEPTPPELVSDDTSSDESSSRSSNEQQGLREASEGNSADSNCSATEESDSSYSSAEEGDSDSSYSSAEEGVSDTEEDEEDEANWLDSLYLLLANAGAENPRTQTREEKNGQSESAKSSKEGSRQATGQCRQRDIAGRRSHAPTRQDLRRSHELQQHQTQVTQRRSTTTARTRLGTRRSNESRQAEEKEACAAKTRSKGNSNGMVMDSSFHHDDASDAQPNCLNGWRKFSAATANGVTGNNCNSGCLSNSNTRQQSSKEPHTSSVSAQVVPTAKLSRSESTSSHTGHRSSSSTVVLDNSSNDDRSMAGTDAGQCSSRAVCSHFSCSGRSMEVHLEHSDWGCGGSG